MDIAYLQHQQLTKVAEWAEQIREHLQPVLERNLGQVHFRPSSRGVAMVGLLPERPQRGKGSYKDVEGLADHFDEEFRLRCVEIEQGKVTPEKALQSWMIAEAYQHDRSMVSIDEQLCFVTDEIALPIDGGRIVCDLLALRDTEQGPVPVILELKSKRELKRLVAQVNGYASLVDQHRELFGRLCSILLDRPVALAGPCEKWIVWPAEGEARDPREEELARVGIRVVGYEQTDEGFRFRISESPRRSP